MLGPSDSAEPKPGGMKNSFCSDRISDGYSSFYFTTVGAIFVIATNSTLA
jgi:hypothetical protein